MYKRKIEETSYNQQYAHCYGDKTGNLDKFCRRCIRRYVADMLPKMGIHRTTSIKPVKTDLHCMMFIDKDECKQEVHELEKMVEMYEDEQMNEI